MFLMPCGLKDRCFTAARLEPAEWSVPIPHTLEMTRYSVLEKGTVEGFDCASALQFWRRSDLRPALSCHGGQIVFVFPAGLAHSFLTLLFPFSGLTYNSMICSDTGSFFLFPLNWAVV